MARESHSSDLHRMLNKIDPRLVGALAVICSALGTVAQAGEATPPTPQSEPAAQALSFPVSYTGEVLGNLSGGYKQGAVYDGLLNVGVKGDLEKLVGWQGGSFLVSGLYPHGASLTAQYVHDFNGVSNIDAYDSVRLYEVWVQQEFAEGRFSIRFGQLLADSEFFISNDAALFVNSAFGAIPLVSQNFDAPIFPVAAPGVRLAWKVSESFAVQAGLYDGTPGDPATDNTHGVDWRLNGSQGVLALAEAAYTYNPGKGGLGGVYKLGAFYHSNSEDDAFPENGSHADAGGYFIADQSLWRKPGTDGQGLSAFLRIGGAPADRSTVPFYFDTGFNFKGLIPGRAGDIAGIGLSYTKLSPDLRDDDGLPVETHHETILEATYKIQLKEWLTLQPDVQYIFNPGASEKADNAVVAGVRFNVSF
jgi:porin